jgi:hypothetical protein
VKIPVNIFICICCLFTSVWGFCDVMQEQDILLSGDTIMGATIVNHSLIRGNVSLAREDDLPPHSGFPIPKQKKENRPRVGLLPAYYYSTISPDDATIVYDKYSPESIGDFFYSVISELVDQVDRSLVVVLGTFIQGDTGEETGLSRYLERHCALAITRNENIQLFARDKLEEILKLHELGLSDLFAGASGLNIGGLNQVNGLISGYFFEQEDDVLLFLTLIDIETGLYLGSVSLRINKNLLV